jgi:MinD-like ATPase involved in chromosome partitioning or flagellar assembly
VAALGLALPPDLEESVALDAVRHGHAIVARAGSAHALLERLGELRPDAVIVGASPRYLTPELLVACDDGGVRMIVLADGDVERRRTISTGLRDPLEHTATWAEIERRLAGGADEPSPPDPAQGTTIAVWGPAGAPGRTSVAIAIAAELAAVGKRVVLADVDSHAASVAPMLGLLDEAPGFAAACRLAGSGSLDVAELDRISDSAGGAVGGFRVLTGLGRPSRWPELTADRVAGVMRQCRGWADVTVLDLAASLESDEQISSDLHAPRRNGATMAVLREADQVVAVGSADPVGLSRLLRSYADLVEAVSTRAVHVLVNRLRASAVGMSAAGQVEETLQRFGGIPRAAFVPYDLAAFDAAVLTGGTLVQHAPKSHARLALRDFTLARFAEPELRPRRLGRRRAVGTARLP